MKLAVFLIIVLTFSAMATIAVSAALNLSLPTLSSQTQLEMSNADSSDAQLDGDPVAGGGGFPG